MAEIAISTEDWRTLPWQAYQRNVFRLQKRIYQAARRGDWKRVRRRRRATAIAAFMVSPLFGGEAGLARQSRHAFGGTPGVDGVASLTPEERLTYAYQLRYLSRWTVDPIRRTYIHKPNNPTEKRGLGIPTMRDRAMQALYALVLKSIAETLADPNSYGFRDKRNCHDAIQQVYNALARSYSAVWILEGDIKSCFD